MAYIYTRITLDDIDTDDLIEELERRHLDIHEQDRLLKMVQDEDSKKLSVFLKAQNKFSVAQLEEMFSEKYNVAAGENQIAITFNS